MYQVLFCLVSLYALGYNAYHHNFQLLGLWTITFLNSVSIGYLVNRGNDEEPE